MSDLNVKVILKLVKDGFDNAVDGAKAKINELTGGVKASSGWLNTSIAYVASWFTTLGAVAVSALSVIKPAFAPVLTGLSSLAAFAGSLVPPGFAAMASRVVASMSAMSSGIVSRIAVTLPALSGLSSATAWVTGAFGAMAARVSSIMSGMTAAVAVGATGIGRAITTIAAFARTATSGLAAAFSGLTGLIGGVIAQLGGLLAPLLGIAAAIKTISTASEFEQFELRLKGAFNGIIAQSQKAIDWIKQFAVNTTFSVRQATDAFLSLKGFGLDPMDGTLRKIGDAAAKWGADAGALMGITRQLGQAWARGTLQLQDMNAMVDNGLPVINLLSQALGVSADKILEMSEKGELGRDVIRKLIAEMGNQSAGLMKDRMVSLAGAVSNMGDAFDNAIDDIRKTGGFQWITDSVRGFTALIPALIKTVADMGGALSAVFGELASVVGTVFRSIDTVINAVLGQSGTGSTAIDGFIKLLKSLQVIFIAVQTGFEVTFGSIKTILAFFAAVLKGAGNIADRVLHLDFAGAVEAWNDGFADLKAVMSGSIQDIIDAALRGRKDLDAVWQKPIDKPAIPDNPELPLPEVATGKGDAKAFEKINKAKLDSALAAIKAEEEAAKNAHDIALAQAEAEFKAKELQLKRLGLSETETQARSLVLANELAAKKLKIEADYLKQSHDLEMKAIDEKIKAQQAALVQPSAGKSSGFAGAQATNSETIITRLTQELQLSRAQAAGVVGNLFQESGLSSTAVNRTSGAFGIAQWLGSRKKELKQFAKSRGELITDFNTQVDFLIHELNSSEKRALTALRGTNDVSSATTTFRKAFERPGEAEANDTRRVSAAKSAFGSGSGDNADQQADVEQLKALQAQKLALIGNYQAKVKLLGIAEQADKTELAGEELALAQSQNVELNALLQQRADAEAAAALDSLAQKEADSQTELALGNITQEQHLANLQDFAQERLSVEMAVLEKKRALLGNDKLALEKNLEDMKALWRKYQGDVKALNDNATIEQQNQAKGLFAPFENAIEQSANGILTGQQTLANAARNAAQSILVSYLSTSIKQRAIWLADWAFQAAGISKLAVFKEGTDAAGEKFDIILFAGRKLRKLGEWAFDSAGTLATEVRKRGAKLASVAFDNVLSIGKRARLAFGWAWDFAGETALAARKRALKLAQSAWENLQTLGKKAKMVAFWAWDLLGFAGNESAKTVAKATSEAAMTGVQVAGDTARTDSTVAAEKASKEATAETTMSKIINFAVQAAGAVYASVATIPYVGWILAPIAAAATFIGVMALGAMASFAEKGELEVQSDNAPYFLHKRESVLPAPVADNFRKVVNIVDDVKAGFVGASFANVDSAIKELRQEGRFNAPVSVPKQALSIAADSQETANLRAKTAREVEIERLVTQAKPVVNQTTHHSQTHFSPVYHNSFVDTAGAKRFFDQHGDVMARKIQERTRKGAFGPVGVKNA